MVADIYALANHLPFKWSLIDILCIYIWYMLSPSNITFLTLRNSWGSDWGEDGYINIKRSITENLNMCRVSEFAEFPVVTSESQ